MNAIRWASFWVQVLLFIFSAVVQARIKPQARRYYIQARCALVFQAACFALYIAAMMENW